MSGGLPSPSGASNQYQISNGTLLARPVRAKTDICGGALPALELLIRAAVLHQAATALHRLLCLRCGDKLVSAIRPTRTAVLAVEQCSPVMGDGSANLVAMRLCEG
jgi:hypothetical protein